MLINCLECGREISDKAASCPHCGNPLNGVIVESTKESPAPTKSNAGAMGFNAAGAVFVLLAGILPLWHVPIYGGMSAFAHMDTSYFGIASVFIILLFILGIVAIAKPSKELSGTLAAICAIFFFIGLFAYFDLQSDYFSDIGKGTPFSGLVRLKIGPGLFMLLLAAASYISALSITKSVKKAEAHEQSESKNESESQSEWRGW